MSTEPPPPPEAPPPSQAPPPSEEDDRRFVNNPFARALHPKTGRRTVGQWVALVVVSIVGAVIMGAAFLFPIAVTWGLLARSHGRVGMLAAGVMLAAIYALILASLWRRRRRR